MISKKKKSNIKTPGSLEVCNCWCWVSSAGLVVQQFSGLLQCHRMAAKAPGVASAWNAGRGRKPPSSRCFLFQEKQKPPQSSP